MLLLGGKTKVIVFSDFDGTITLNDSNGMIIFLHMSVIWIDYLTDNLGFGVDKRLSLNEAVLDHSRTFRYRYTRSEVTVAIFSVKCWIA